MTDRLPCASLNTGFRRMSSAAARSQLSTTPVRPGSSCRTKPIELTGTGTMDCRGAAPAVGAVSVRASTNPPGLSGSMLSTGLHPETPSRVTTRTRA